MEGRHFTPNLILYISKSTDHGRVPRMHSIRNTTSNLQQQRQYNCINLKVQIPPCLKISWEMEEVLIDSHNNNNNHCSLLELPIPFPAHNGVTPMALEYQYLAIAVENLSIQLSLYVHATVCFVKVRFPIVFVALESTRTMLPSIECHLLPSIECHFIVLILLTSPSPLPLLQTRMYIQPFQLELQLSIL